MSPPISFIQGDDVAIAVNITQTGLATRTASSAVLTGTNTSWTNALNGCNITFPDGFTTTVSSVTNSTTLNMSTPATTTDTQPVIYTAAVNITGYTIYFTVKLRPNPLTSDSQALILANVTSHPNPAQGISSIPLPRSQTNIEAGTYYYDIRVGDANGNIQSIRFGQCIIYPAITQRVS